MIPGQVALRSNLPAQVSSFIGRERELEQIARLLRQQRLVTVTGAGGIGKTRLALQAAAAELDRFADGVWLVELAPLASPELVAETVGKVLALRTDPTAPDPSPLGGLCAFLRAKHMLLVLDNCEHVIAACADIVARLLADCPAVTVLATSREPLGIAGEWVLRAPPLRLPDGAQPIEDDAQRLLSYDGIRLFVERAQAAEPSFRLTEVNATSVVDVCRQLDGMPLALELAAVRVRGMGVAYMSTRLNDRFRLLTGGDRTTASRQQALHTSLDWSHSLLPEAERVVLRRLGVFAGSFSLEAAEAVCAGEYVGQSGQALVLSDAVLDSLLQLVNKSLIQLDQDSGRYRLLETIRLYAQERLGEADETNEVRRRHFVHYLQLAEDGVTLVGGPHQEAWFTRIELEHDNLRAALGWAIDARQTDEAARMALGIWRFWHVRTYQREGLRWLEQILALDATNPLPDALRPRLLNALGVLAERAARFDRAREYHAEAQRLWTAADDRAGMAQALFDIGWQHFDQVQLEPARQCAMECLSLAESIGDARLIASALLLRAMVDVNESRLDGIIPALERSVMIWRELGDMDNLGTTLAGLAVTYQQSGDYERAKPLLAESVRLHLRLGSYGNLISTFVGLMWLAVGTADQLDMAQDAARIFGVMAAWEDTTSGSRSPWWESEIGRGFTDKVAARLGPETMAQAVADGKSLTTAGFLALADRITAPTSDAGPPAPTRPVATSARYGDLTARELEVLRLVARGLTNAEAARELTVTPRTVNAHLTAIYSKLGVTGRSGAIRYAIDHQLG
ncbi:MAG TPA: LuxR C-terminal-related transcriptional regulator [Ktedonobacterales bacterium]|nr:LuxR C-terminal-related transcriptional regulator [Ktedonobacterales bacterium]